MIHFCSCTGGSASSLKSHKHQEGSKTCENCGGKLSVVGRGALSGSMASTLGPEFSRAIDPHLNWKTSPRGGQRGVRRPRTSFTSLAKKKSTPKSTKASEDLNDKELKSKGDMSVSESEKFGVSILGRRFKDTLENVPIKKRRFLFVRSPSPPPQSSSHSDDSDQIRECQSVSYGEAASIAKQHSLDANSGIRRESAQKRLFADEKTSLKDQNEKLCDNADFSGISILAAVAIMNAEGSVSKENNSQGEVLRCAEAHCLQKEKDEQICTKVDLDGETNIPMEVSTTLLLPGKGSVGIKLDESLDNSTSPLQNVRNKTSRLEPSSRDNSFPWDLNTVMDVSESHNDGTLNSKPPHVANIIGETSVCDEKLGNMEPDQDQVGFGNVKSASELVNSIGLGDLREDYCASKDTKVQEKLDVCGDSSVPDNKEGNKCFSLPHGNGFVPEEHELEDASVDMVDAAYETVPLHNQEKNCFITGVVSCSISGTLVSSRDSSMVTAACKEEKTDTCCVSFGALVETKLTSPSVSCENARFDRSHACESSAVTDEITGVLYEKNTTAASGADHEDHLAHCCQTDVQIAQATHLRSPPDEKHVSLCAGIDKADRCSVASPITGKASDVMVNGNICNDMMTTTGLSGESEHTNDSDGADCGSGDKYKKASMGPIPSDSQTFNSQVLSNHDELSSGGSYAREHETPDEDMKMQDHQLSVLSDETLNHNGADYTVHIGSQIPVCSSVHMKPCMVDVPPIDNAVNSHEASKSYADGYAISPGQVALEDHFDCDYYSDASQMDTDQPADMEKVECLGDDDYQYEDGEFRESVVHTWGEDETEEGESEHVDYGSDNRETDILESACDFPDSALEHVDRVEGMNEGFLDANHGHKNGEQAGRKTCDSVCQPLLKFLPIAGDSDSGSAKRLVKGGIKKLERYAKNGSESGAVCDTGDKECLNECDASRRSSHSGSCRMKLSGWDRLPEGCRDAGGAVMVSGVDTFSRNHTDASLGASIASESLRRVAGSSLRRDMPFRFDRPDSSDVSHIKDKSYVRSSRSNDRDDFDSRVERDRGAPRSIGRGGSSLYLHGRGRHDSWLNSPTHCGPRSHGSHGYYGSSSFTHQASRNAAAATAAKLESNGFVVAPDGTILKAGGVGHTDRVPIQSAKASSHSIHPSLMGRRSSIERDGEFGMPLELDNSRETGSERHISIGQGRACRYGPGMVSAGRRVGYHRQVPDGSIDASSPLQNRLTRREQCLSPHRRPLRRSRTRSPSRSRTRSPHIYASPRGRNDSGMNAGRLRSPHRRSGLVERMVGYAPSNRNHTSPPHASRWVDERKDVPVNFREHNRFSGRSPLRRVFSRRQRLDPVDSPGRVKSNEYSRSMHFRRIAEFTGFDGRSTYDECGDDKIGFGNKYAMVHCARPYNTDGNMKHFRYDAEDGFRSHNPQPRSSEFPQRESPMGFDRSIENQLADSPRRAKEEKVHARYGREGKRNAGFKSFGVRDCTDDMTPQRTPS